MFVQVKDIYKKTIRFYDVEDNSQKIGGDIPYFKTVLLLLDFLSSYIFILLLLLSSLLSLLSLLLL